VGTEGEGHQNGGRNERLGTSQLTTYIDHANFPFWESEWPHIPGFRDGKPDLVGRDVLPRGLQGCILSAPEAATQRRSDQAIGHRKKGFHVG
jgi:hypothetical protein